MPKSGPKVGLVRARHVFGRMPAWQPCSRAHPTSAPRAPAFPSRQCGGRRSHLTHAELPPLPPSLSGVVRAPGCGRHGRRCQAPWPLLHLSFKLPLSLPCTVAPSLSCAAPPRLRQPAAAALGPPLACCAHRGRSLTGGQATYHRLGPRRAVPWMLMDPLMLVLPFSVAAGPPPASPPAIPCSLLVGRREGPRAKIRAKEGA